MDHTKLHKQSIAKRNADDNKVEKVRRRSIAQKQRRKQIHENKRDLSPLKERTNLHKHGDRVEMKAKLEIWRKERDIKRKKDQMKSKPVFKVSSNIKRNDKEFALSKATSKAKENQPTTSHLVEKKKEKPVARVTRSRAANSKITSGVVKPADIKKKSTTSKAKINKSNEKENKSESKAQKQHHNRSNEKLPAQETVSNSKEENQQVSNSSTRTNSDSDPFSKSFAPANCTFKAPAGIKSYNFSANIPNSNESFIYSSKGGPTNFVCSTPLTIPPPEMHKKTPVPMVLSSASGTSDEENSDQANTVLEAGNKKDAREDEIVDERNTNQDNTVLQKEIKENEEKVQSFRNLVIVESEVLTTHCREWEKIQENYKNMLTEEVVGEIRTVIGQAQLLMAERFHQFSKLIDKYEKPSPDHNPVTPTDLKGFWEMIYYQVDDVKNKFKNLKTLQDNNWEKPQEAKKKITRKRKASTAAKGSSAHKRAARKRIKEAREAMKAKLQEEEKEADDKEEQEPPAKSSEPTPSTSKTISGDDYSSQDNENGPMTRSRRKTPGGKNVSFATPRSKKRKAQFSLESPDDKQKTATPGSQPRKRVMRKTPLPGPRPDSTLKDSEDNTSPNEDVQASPSLKMNRSNDLIADAVDTDEGEIKGVKLNFDDVESDNETNENSIDMKYLPPTENEIEDIVKNKETNNDNGFDKYLMASHIDSPVLAVSNASVKETCTDSPGRVLRSKRKSPFLKPSSLVNEVLQPDLMSFSPLPTAKDEIKSSTSQNDNFDFATRKSKRLLTCADSLECLSADDDNDQGNAVGLIPSLL